MPFKNKSSESTLVYSYDCTEPHENLEAVLDQIKLSKEYGNKLVELLRDRITAEEELLAPYGDLPSIKKQIDKITEQIRGLDQQIKDHKVARHFKQPSGVDVDACEAEIHRLARLRKSLWIEHADEVKRLKKVPEVKEPLQTIYDEWNSKTGLNAYREGFKSRGLFWATANRVIDDKKWSRGQRPPRFHPVNTQGAVDVQIQSPSNNTKTKEYLFTENNFARLVPAGHKWEAWLRLGGTGPGYRTPILTKVYFRMHRPLPPGKLNAVKLVRTRVGIRYYWKIQFNISPDTRKSFNGKGVAGIDFNWRKFNDNLRVATFSGSDGDEDHLFLKIQRYGRRKGTPHGWRKVDELQATMDSRRVKIIKELKEWAKGRDIPEWLSETLTHLHNYGSAKLARLVRHWEQNRFPGDDFFNNMKGHRESWYDKDKHLFDMKEHMRKKLERNRLDTYRKFAVRLARKYHTIVFEKENLKNKKGQTASPFWKDTAALHILKKCIRETGVQVLEVDGKHTQTCHRCQQETVITSGVTQNCIGCGDTWDRDINSARNALRHGMEKLGKELTFDWSEAA